MTFSRRPAERPAAAADATEAGRRRLLIVGIVALVILVVILFPKGKPADTTPIPGTGVTFVKPAGWRTIDHDQVLDPGWAADQKGRFPDQAAFFDGWVNGVASGDIDYTAVIDPTVQGGDPEGWVDGEVSPATITADQLATVAAESVDRQPVPVRDATAVSLNLPGGPVTRLDFAYDLFLQTGAILPVHVRSYWLVDRSSLVVLRLTTFGDGHDLATAGFDQAATTLRWPSPAGSGAPS